MSTKSAFWQAHLIAWRDSGLSQAAYCHQEGLSLPCFGYWRSKLRESLPLKKTSAKALMPFVVSAVPAVSKHIEVELPNGLQVRIPVGMDETRWVAIIRALRAC